MCREFSPLVLRKASFDTSGEMVLHVSAEAFNVVHVDTQCDKPTIWYETIDNPPVKQVVKFLKVRSGGEVPNKSKHVGVSRVDYGNEGGEVFWHVYQIYK